MGAAGALQVYQRALVAQQVLPMGAAVSAALAVVAAGAVVAARARQPGTAGTVGGRINRQHLLSNQGTLVHLQCAGCGCLWSTDTRERADRRLKAA